MHDGANLRTEGEWSSMQLGSSRGEVTNCLVTSCQAPTSRCHEENAGTDASQPILDGIPSLPCCESRFFAFQQTGYGATPASHSFIRVAVTSNRWRSLFPVSTKAAAKRKGRPPQCTGATVNYSHGLHRVNKAWKYIKKGLKFHCHGRAAIYFEGCD